MEYTLLCMYEHHKKYINWGGGGGGGRAKFALQHMSIVYYSYTFIKILLKFSNKIIELLFLAMPLL